MLHEYILNNANNLHIMCRVDLKLFKFSDFVNCMLYVYNIFFFTKRFTIQKCSIKTTIYGFSWTLLPSRTLLEIPILSELPRTAEPTDSNRFM